MSLLLSSQPRHTVPNKKSRQTEATARLSCPIIIITTTAAKVDGFGVRWVCGYTYCLQSTASDCRHHRLAARCTTVCNTVMHLVKRWLLRAAVLSIYLSICLSIYLSICLSVCLSVCLSIRGEVRWSEHDSISMWHYPSRLSDPPPPSPPHREAVNPRLTSTLCTQRQVRLRLVYRR